MQDHYGEVMTLEELCEYLKIGRNNAYLLLRSGAIKAVRIGRVWRIPYKAVQSFLHHTM